MPVKPVRKRGPAYFGARLDAAWAAYSKAVHEIADDAREQYVVPYCDRTGKRFLSGGNGDWCFGDGELNEAPKQVKAVLSLTPFGMETIDLGACMEGYTPKKDGDA